MNMQNNTASLIEEPSRELDASDTSVDHAHKIRSNIFLRKIYEENYAFFLEELSDVGGGAKLELGSGGGFISEVIPGVLTSDLVPLPTTDLVYSALKLPFVSESVSAILMMNVLHHLQDVSVFFEEADRCMQAGAKVIMIEPAHTLLSRLIYTYLHHEPFEPNRKEWELPPGGRLSMSNQALPWILFRRDYDTFRSKFPSFELTRYENFMPFRYILSGGVSRPPFLPPWSYGAVKGIETLLAPLNNQIGLFAKIVLRKN